MGQILVRVAPELLEHMKDGDVEPVVILGVQDNGDGTHDMTLMKPEIVVERDQLREDLGAIAHVFLAYENAPSADQPTYRAELIAKVREIVERRWAA